MRIAYLSNHLFPFHKDSWSLETNPNWDSMTTKRMAIALHTRRIVNEQCHYIDSEFKARMSEAWIK